MHLNLLEKKLNSNLLYSYIILIILWMSTIYYLIDKKFHTHAHEHICIYIHTYIHTYCGDNFCIVWLTKLVVFYHHWSSLIWHEDEDFPSNAGLSKAKNDYKCNTWSRQKLSPHIHICM